MDAPSFPAAKEICDLSSTKGQTVGQEKASRRPVPRNKTI